MAEKTPLKVEDGLIKQFAATDTIPLANLPSGIGGGATGGGTDAVFFENDQHVTTSYTITSGKNAMSTGPVTIDAGASITVPSGSRWVIL